MSVLRHDLWLLKARSRFHGVVRRLLIHLGARGDPVNVCAIIVTRGDVDLDPVLESLPVGWEKVVWDNSPLMTFAPEYHWRGLATCAGPRSTGGADLGVYGRYAAVKHTTADLIYVQDDDVIVSDPQAIVDAWLWGANFRDGVREPPERTTEFSDHPAGREVLVANMPIEFRHDGYTDSCLVGFGACFHRDAPARAFDRFWKRSGTFEEQIVVHLQMPLVGSDLDPSPATRPMVGPPPVFFQRTCDVVFTTLTPRVLVDVPKVNREFAEDEGRMYRQPGHVEERARMLELARKVRDGR